MNTNSTEYDVTDDEILAAIAEQGERKHVLAELEYRNGMSTIGAREGACENGLPDPNAEEIAADWIEGIEAWWSETYTTDELNSELEYHEEKHGNHDALAGL